MTYERRVRGKFVVVDGNSGQNLGTFLTDSANSILDKMVLHKMFPQFELKSLRIVSLNCTTPGVVSCLLTFVK